MHMLIMSKISTSPDSDRSVESTRKSQVYVPKLLVLLNEVFNSNQVGKT